MRSPILAALAITVFAACQQAPAPLSEEDVAAIRALNQEFVAADLAHDYPRLAETHTQDVAWMNPDAPAVVGREALIQALQAGPRATSFALRPDVIEGVGDLAWSRGSFTYAGMMDDMSIAAAGKYVQIVKRQADGSWKFAVAIWNSDSPPEMDAQ